MLTLDRPVLLIFNCHKHIFLIYCYVTKLIALVQTKRQYFCSTVLFIFHIFFKAFGGTWALHWHCSRSQAQALYVLREGDLALTWDQPPPAAAVRQPRVRPARSARSARTDSRSSRVSQPSDVLGADPHRSVLLQFKSIPLHQTHYLQRLPPLSFWVKDRADERSVFKTLPAQCLSDCSHHPSLLCTLCFCYCLQR